MTRINATFSLDLELMELLKARAKETGEKLSRLVDLGIRSALSFPMPEATDDGPVFAPTRSEHAMLRALNELCIGNRYAGGASLWRAAGLSRGVAEKALNALAARGEAFLWGAMSENHDGTFCDGWGLVHPHDAVRNLITGLGANPEWRGMVLLGARELAWSIDDVQPVRAMLAEYFGVPVDDPRMGVVSCREHAARGREAERQRAAKV